MKPQASATRRRELAPRPAADRRAVPARPEARLGEQWPVLRRWLSAREPERAKGRAGPRALKLALRWQALVVVAALLATAHPAPLPAAQQEDFAARLARALAALDSTETERGVELLRQLLAAPPAEAPRAAIVRAHLHLAAASLSLGLADSARTHLAEMVRLNPFAVPDAELFNPDLQDAYRAARRATRAVGLRLAADTVIKPATDFYLIAVAVGMPGEVAVRLLRTDTPGPGGVETRLRVDSTRSFALALRGADSLPLEPGEYRLSARLLPETGDSAAVTLRLSREPVDTALPEPPLAAALFRPETRQGPPVAASAVLGLIFGAAAAALPSVLSNKELGSQKIEIAALSVGAGISVAGIAGVFAGRSPVPIADNIEYNRSLVAAWEARNRAIAQQNERTRRLAPLRVRSVSP